MGTSNATVAIYAHHEDAEAAVMELQKAGFDMKKLSIVGRDFVTDERVVGYYNTGDRMKSWGKLGAFWGGIWGLLLGRGYFFIPGLCPVLVAGPLVHIIVTTLEGAVNVGGMSAVSAGLYSLGIPKNSVLDYELALKANKYLLVAHGSGEEVARAKDILSRGAVATPALHLR